MFLKDTGNIFQSGSINRCMNDVILPIGSLAKLHQYKKSLELAASADLSNKRKALADSLKSLKKRAYAAGFRQGYSDGQSRALSGLADDAERYRSVLLSAGTDCLNLVMQIVREIIGEKTSLETAGLEYRIKTALKALALSQDYQVTLNPEDASKIPMAHSSSAISKGNAMIETAGGSIILDLDQQLKQIEKLLHSRLSNQIAGDKNSAGT